MGVAIFDPGGNVRSADAGAAMLLAIPATQLVGLGWQALVSAETAAAFEGVVDAYLTDPVPRVVGDIGREVRLTRADGTSVGVALWLLPLVGPDRAIAVLAIDLQRGWAIRRSEANLAAAQRITHCGSWELDLTDLSNINGNRLRWSDEAFRIFGYAPRSIEVTNEAFFRAVHPDDRAVIEGAVKQAVETGTLYAIDHRVVWPDGSVRIVHEQSDIQRDAGGRPLLMIGTVQDVTEAREAVEKLRRAEQAAVVADRLASAGIVAAGVAHEINNPLAAAMINLDVLSKQLGPNTPLDEARAGLERVREIVRDLRVFARPDEDRQLAIDVTHVLDSTLRLADGTIAAHARVVRQYLTVPPVLATEARLGQVFMNLLINAAQAIPEGTDGEIHVSTSVDAQGWVVVVVRDSGVGIPAALQAKVFTPFFTTKEVGMGTGLGLSICHRLVTGLGGEISFQSAEGKGTAFRVRLPPAPASAPRPSAPAMLPRAGAPARARILVVDDEPTITTALWRLLGREHDVVVCNDPVEALALLRADERFDVILCDLLMPTLNGIELHAALPPALATRFVPMTGAASSAEARRFLAGRRFIEKPFDLPRLIAVVEALIHPEG